MLDVRVIAAIGRRGQIGLNGKLPWGRDKADLGWFRDQTMGGVVVIGGRTHLTMPYLPGRIVAEWHRFPGMPDSARKPELFIEHILRPYEHWPKLPILWIAGGAETYRTFAFLQPRLVLSIIDYDGPADTWFPWDAFGMWPSEGGQP